MIEIIEKIKCFFSELFKVMLIMSIVVVPSCFFYYTASAVGWRTGVEFMQEEALKRGYGEYNSKTGRWQWKEKND